ncbi:unnamed protein product [Bursaphelenchus xylophilus]|uniref:(pine wood nematode) hypothetical protein n=1 Tax=Bursaphelenchus xylophilus TaxID=6326 RepID=A0A1I7SLN1_BURXY|nr:unnamed protein product [Bursaphelenchus xylophilus]CAG9129678.1 unnamed protein product [Bursaphelenchus xylophilus]
MRLALLVAALGTAIHAEIWTEADESRRIAQLKQEESRVFEMQMRGQNPFAGNPSNIYSNGHVGYTPHYGYDPYVGPMNYERKGKKNFQHYQKKFIRETYRNNAGLK